mmetsp:Transcript_6551/g.27551  ORF Transcript_6551/g.27551 Transcript_6551/m.27551 type:complete len:102 (-) Transcript_6551:48-353(-)
MRRRRRRRRRDRDATARQAPVVAAREESAASVSYTTTAVTRYPWMAALLSVVAVLAGRTEVHRGPPRDCCCQSIRRAPVSGRALCYAWTEARDRATTKDLV